jgi:hypothetical protein
VAVLEALDGLSRRSKGGAGSPHPRAAMANLIAQVRTIGWAVVEAAFLLIVLCVLLNIILGNEANSFVTAVANNATDFLQKLPAGVFLGIVLIAAAYAIIRSRLVR